MTDKTAGGIIATAKMEALFSAAESEGAMAQAMRVASLVASIRRIHFDALVKVGFTPDQALVLCVNTAI